MTKANIEHFRYTWKHKKAYLKVEKELRGFNTLDGYLHDIDKLFMYILTPLSTKTIKNIHLRIANHHVEHKHPRYDRAVIDYECNRFTKPDKPETAYERALKYHSEHMDKLLPYLEQWNLIPK